MTERPKFIPRDIKPDGVDAEWEKAHQDRKQDFAEMFLYTGLAANNARVYTNSDAAPRLFLNVTFEGKVIKVDITRNLEHFNNKMSEWARDQYLGRKKGEPLVETEETKEWGEVIKANDRRINPSLPKIGENFGMMKGNSDPITGNPLPNSENDGDEDNWGSDF